ncbi:uncharacterized protein BDR25DRAFT_314179 [Lindgomyces ingoldianus]|uniref:Uncharacterized protein n=1 Tax=Lindgomyces ingoldianus TaxID=673940 RepID=A0ACB6QVW1_9PLEO|nr:uncharacterized protein BDR25DRAFT_314179 [Lindgomyces ingoldianus]KAF2471011.1 hypothetical protein BDR25DRAFT_314179 [Lindgomyces ingoldianus]
MSIQLFKNRHNLLRIASVLSGASHVVIFNYDPTPRIVKPSDETDPVGYDLGAGLSLLLSRRQICLKEAAIIYVKSVFGSKYELLSEVAISGLPLRLVMRIPVSEYNIKFGGSVAEAPGGNARPSDLGFNVATLNRILLSSEIINMQLKKFAALILSTSLIGT